MRTTLRVACVQLAAHSIDQAEDGLAHALQMTDEAAKAAPDFIVLPECTYPAYYLHALRTPATQAPHAGRSGRSEHSGYSGRLGPQPHLGLPQVRPCKEVLALFAERARRFRCHLAVGLVEEAPDGRLFNTAFLLGPDGMLVGKARKQFLWHFDSRWFSPGDELDVFPTPWGTVGLFICADARMPEIPRTLALKGARLLIDPTNLVSTGKDATRLTSAQVDYMLRARAIENRAWIAAANKVGMDEDSILYCGRSLVISPSGNVVAQASSDRPEVIIADICLPLDRTYMPGEADAPRDASGVPCAQRNTPNARDAHDTLDALSAPAASDTSNTPGTPGAPTAGQETGTVASGGRPFDPLEDRRPATYSILVKEFESLPVSACLEEPFLPEKLCPVIAALQLDPDTAADISDLAARLEKHLVNLAVQGVEIVVLPEPNPRAHPATAAQAIAESQSAPIPDERAAPDIVPAKMPGAVPDTNADRVPSAVKGAVMGGVTGGVAGATPGAPSSVIDAVMDTVPQRPPRPGRLLDCVLDITRRVRIAVVVVDDEVVDDEAGSDGTVSDGAGSDGAHVEMEIAGKTRWPSEGCRHRHRTAYYVDRGVIRAAYRKVHLDADERAAYAEGEGPYQVVRTPRGNFGIMLGCEGLLPEVARILTLEGADAILWPCRFHSNQLDRPEWFARTRAAENRVFVVATNLVGARAGEGDGGGGGRGRGGARGDGGGASLVVDPRGAVLAQAFADREQAIIATLTVADARCKEIVPGTDAVRARRPALYKALTK
ncbi:MAG: carbon-nitrogen hydrolase family protein [Bacteroidota bacterium]